MRRSLVHFCLCGGFALGSLAASVSHAQDGDLFGRLDANGDGVITAEEAGDKKAIFERLLRNADKNEDGKLSKEEFAAGLKDAEPAKPQPGGFGDGAGAPGRGPGAFNLEEMLKRIDKDGDRKISKEEAPDRMRDNFDRIDANSDGFIEPRELLKMAEMMQGNPPRPGEGSRPAEGTPRPDMRPEVRPDFPPFARIFDKDQNGELSTEEIAGAAEALKKLDANGDGKLTGAELIAAFGDMPRPDAARPAALEGVAAAMQKQMLERLKQADANGDGKLSKEEAPDRLKERFDVLDANEDGFLDDSELQKIAERLREQFRNRPEAARPAGDRPERPAGDRKRPE